MKAYKICRIVDGKYKSATKHSGIFDYAIGVETKPPHGYGPMACFRRKKDAMKIFVEASDWFDLVSDRVSNFALFECKIVKAKTIAMFCPECLYETIATARMASAVLADSITLTRLIERI